MISSSTARPLAGLCLALGLLCLGCNQDSALPTSVDLAVADAFLAPADSALPDDLTAAPPDDLAVLMEPDLAVRCNGDLQCPAGLICQNHQCLPSAPLILAFAAPVSYPTCSTPWRLAVADLNADGKLDVAVNCQMSNQYQVFQGRGDGSFVARPAQPVGVYPKNIVAGDFNGDGKLDLAVGGSNMPQSMGPRVLLGHGDLTFGPEVFTNTPLDHDLYVAVGDLDGDGHLDLVQANYAGTQAVFPALLGDGKGGFREVDSPARQFQLGVALGDLDRDGKLDAVTSEASGSVGFRHGDGRGGFLAPVLSAAPHSGTWPIALADLDRDGKLDVLDGGSDLLYGKGNGGLEAAVQIGDLAGVSLVADVDRDGQSDLVLTGGDPMAVRRGLGGRRLGPPIPFAAVDSRDAALGDFDRDGRIDVALVDGRHSAFVIILNRSR